MTTSNGLTGMSINVSQANWLNLLPDMKDKNVLKAGTNNIDNIVSISYTSPNNLSCIGDSLDKLNEVVNNFYTNIEEISESSFDYIILDEPEYLLELKSLRRIKQNLFKLSKLLKSGGQIMVCVPDTALSFIYRFFIRTYLKQVKLSHQNYYLCDSSSDEPMTIVPYINNIKWLASDLPNHNEKPFTFKSIAKSYIKRTIFNSMGIYNPFRGLILVASRSFNNDSCFITGYDKLKRVTQDEVDIIKYEGLELVCVCMTAKYLMKHYLFFYNKLNGDLVLIGKVGYKSDLHIDDMERDYRNLDMVSDCKVHLDKFKIKVASSDYYSKSLNKSILIQTAVAGKSLRYIFGKMLSQNMNDDLLGFLDKITDVQINIQDICLQNLSHKVSAIDNDYFYNYLNAPLDDILSNESDFFHYIQHGDFAVNNVFLDEVSNEWGVIDWEWLGSGFPPLFDLFSLFTSIRFSKGGVTKYDAFEGYYISFTDSFFDKNWFSEFLIGLVKRYCNHYDLSMDDVYRYFIAFILFHCNKFRKNELPEYQSLYEKMMKFTIDNKDKFIFK
ncbi:MAG: aminoglycoside phosphotransferase family protein [Gammaproteobacteria bacterium]|nr:aminoglycoside phosphotransferase family protein [Gammaproteobacteria bacterium]